MSEKQQYLEGPWERVSGPEPLNGATLEGWKENLDNMYGAENWRAEPVKGSEDKFDIVVSPDYDSVYAGMARQADREGIAGYPSDHPFVRETLDRIAGEEADRVKPDAPETDSTS